MKKYQYQIVRYIHDIVTGEFVNVGVVVFSQQEKFFSAKFTSKYSRITSFFPEANGPALSLALKYFEKAVKKGAEVDAIFLQDSIEKVLSKIIQRDDSSIQCSQTYAGIDLTIEGAMNDLYERMVDKYYANEHKEIRDDKFAWKEVYKKYFDEKGITGRLSTKSINTNRDTITFDKSWQNGSLNCFQTLSLDLQSVDSIKSKIYKWSGILHELDNSNENIHLYFLTLDSKAHPDISTFAKETLDYNSDNVQVTLVNQEDAETFAEQLNVMMEEHGN